MSDTAETYGRLNKLERDTAVHEAICAERYKGITVRLNVLMVGIGILVTAIAAGDPLVALVRILLVR